MCVSELCDLQIEYYVSRLDFRARIEVDTQQQPSPDKEKFRCDHDRDSVVCDLTDSCQLA